MIMLLQKAFQQLKKEKVRGRQYKSRAEARIDMFNYIEMFYNPPKHRHTNNGRVAPSKYEEQYFNGLKSV